jgi:hypothetical protein
MILMILMIPHTSTPAPARVFACMEKDANLTVLATEEVTMEKVMTAHLASGPRNNGNDDLMIS